MHAPKWQQAIPIILVAISGGVPLLAQVLTPQALPQERIRTRLERLYHLPRRKTKPEQERPAARAIFRPQATGGTASTVSLTSSPNPALYGAPVLLTATVAPSSATGRVTFYDGVTVLGTAILASGHSLFTPDLIAPGARAFRARYDGDSATAPGWSAPVLSVVSAVPDSGLQPALLSFTGAAPVGLAAGDFNNDGILDVATANAADGTATVLLGNGTGTFPLSAALTSGNNPYAIVAADFNGDGNLDVALVNSASNTFTILRGNGDGTLSPMSGFPIGGNPVALAAADFNGDGIVDLAIVNANDGAVVILLGNGDGTMADVATFPVGAEPWSVAVGDFNGDGKPDLAVVNSNSNSVSVLLGRGDGTFTAGAPLATPTLPSGVIAGDWNGDGKTDLAVAYSGDVLTQFGGGALVFPGNGNGTFQNFILAATGTEPYTLASGDFNGDGLLDLAVIDLIPTLAPDGFTLTNLDVLMGTGDGFFQLPVSYAAGTSPLALAVADFNGDHTPDIAVASVNDDAVETLLGTAGLCTFALTAPVTLFDNQAAGTALTITTNSPGCPWSVTSDSWLLPQVSGGMATGTMSLAVQANSTGLDRTGTVAVGPALLHITQMATKQTFSDVPITTYYFDAVNLMGAKGITSGCGTNVYCPLANVTRAQMAIFIIRSIYGASTTFPYSPTPWFTDVGPQDFGFAWIQRMKELGITTGCGPTLYCPNDSVTRAQMAIFITRARYGATLNFDFPATPYFTDVPTGSFGFNWIQRLRLDAITQGCATNLYCPNNPVTRGDMAVFIMRGEFNQLLPLGWPLLTAVTPATISRGQSATVTVTGVNTSFAAGQTVLSPIPGVTIGLITVNSPTSLSVQLTAASNAIPQPVSIVAVTGTQEAVIPNALLVQ